MAIWSSAEYYVGIIVGSIPPCRALVLQTVHNFRDKASRNEKTTGVSSPRSGYFYSLQNSSRGSRSLQKNHIPMRPWNVKANRALSQDSGRESILPLHSVSGANPDTGIWKTVDVRVGTSEDDGSLATDKFEQR